MSQCGPSRGVKQKEKLWDLSLGTKREEEYNKQTKQEHFSVAKKKNQKHIQIRFFFQNKSEYIKQNFTQKQNSHKVAEITNDGIQ